MYFIATIFKIHEHQFQQRNTTRCNPQYFPITLRRKAGCSHSLPEQHVQNKNLKIKAMPASFIKAKYLNLKVCLLQKTFPQNLN